MINTTRYNVEIKKNNVITCSGSNLAKEDAYKLADIEGEKPENKTSLIIICKHLDINGNPKVYPINLN